MDALIDVNVVLPLLLRAHPHRGMAAAWWDSVEDGSVVFCLPVRMGVLRLLCNSRVMGESVLRPEDAWDALATLTSDARARWEVPSDPSLDAYWRDRVAGRHPTPNLWTDAWLAAYAERYDYEMVTFDRGFQRLMLTNLHLLGG
jgi:hypothetical protein